MAANTMRESRGMHSSTPPYAVRAGKPRAIDRELVEKFSEELQSERKNNPGSDDLSAHLQEFLKNNSFQLKDVQGEHDITLTRIHGNETVKVSFSISTLSSLTNVSTGPFQGLDPYSADNAQPNTQPIGAQSRGPTNQGRDKTPEDGIPTADVQELIEDGEAKYYPIPIKVIIDKVGVTSALTFDVLAEDGDLQISGIHHYMDKDWATRETTEEKCTHKAAYTGPVYGTLDEDLQRLFEGYLRERGISTALAHWVSDYIDFKEQREYMKWLGDVKRFLEE